MTILAGKWRLFQPLCLGTLGMVVLAMVAAVSPAADRADAVKKLGFDPTDQPAAKWLPATPKESPNSIAKTEAEMKCYTENLPVEDIKFDLVPIKGGTFKMGSPETEKGARPMKARRSR